MSQYFRSSLIIGSFILCGFIYFKPQAFTDLWLTRDQQGYVYFKLGKYDLAAVTFTNQRWQAYSFYAAEKFDEAAIIYDQFDDTESIFSRANALAHARRYVKSREIYKELLSIAPSHKGGINNLAIIEDIIKQVNLMSKSQKAEAGDAPQELGDKPQTGDGENKQELRKQEVEQYSAQQLLLDKQLNEMWLRQVQKDPASFLTNKFQMQYSLDSNAKTQGDK